MVLKSTNVPTEAVGILKSTDVPTEAVGNTKKH